MSCQQEIQGEIVYKQNWSLWKHTTEKQLPGGDIQAVGMEVTGKTVKNRDTDRQTEAERETEMREREREGGRKREHTLCQGKQY